MTEKDAILLATQKLQEMALHIELENKFDCKIEFQPLFYQSGKIEYTPHLIFGSGVQWRIFYIEPSGEWSCEKYNKYNSIDYWEHIVFKYFESKEKAMETAISFLNKSNLA